MPTTVKVIYRDFDDSLSSKQGSTQIVEWEQDNEDKWITVDIGPSKVIIDGEDHGGPDLDALIELSEKLPKLIEAVKKWKKENNVK